MALIDSEENYAPLQRHPDPPAQTFVTGASNDVPYESTDPTTEGLFPPDQDQPSISYKRGGGGGSYTWDTLNKVWNA